MEIVCDDGVCSQCVKTSEGVRPQVRPWMMRHEHREPEDFLRDGFVCAEEFLEDEGIDEFLEGKAERVCDDGHCVGCKVRPHEGTKGVSY